MTIPGGRSQIKKHGCDQMTKTRNATSVSVTMPISKKEILSALRRIRKKVAEQMPPNFGDLRDSYRITISLVNHDHGQDREHPGQVPTQYGSVEAPPDPVRRETRK